MIPVHQTMAECRKRGLPLTPDNMEKVYREQEKDFEEESMEFFACQLSE